MRDHSLGRWFLVALNDIFFRGKSYKNVYSHRTKENNKLGHPPDAWYRQDCGLLFYTFQRLSDDHSFFDFELVEGSVAIWA